MQRRSLGAGRARGRRSPGAAQGPRIATGGGNDTSAKLRKAVTVDGIKLHEAAFNLFGGAGNGRQPAGGHAGPRALGGLRRAAARGSRGST